MRFPLSEQIDYAVDEKHRYQRGTQRAYVQRPNLSEPEGFGFGMRGDLRDGVFGLPHVTHVNAGEYSRKGQQEGVGHLVEPVEDVHAAYESSLRKRNDHAKSRRRRDDDYRRPFSFNLEFFGYHRDVDLDKRYRRGYRREQHEQEKYHAHDTAEHSGHYRENRRQRYEHQSRAHRGFGARREHRGQYRKSRYHRHERIRNADKRSIRRKADVFSGVTAVSRPDPQSYRQRIERLTESRKENAHYAARAFDAFEIGHYKEFHSFYRAVHRQRNYHYEQQHHEQHRHQHLINALDTVLNAQKYDYQAHRHECDKTDYRLPRAARKRRKHFRIIAAGDETAAVEIPRRVSDYPAAYDAVIRNDQKRSYAADHAHDAPALFLDTVSVDHVFGCVSADSELRYHQRKAHQDYHQHVSYQKDRAALLSRKVRKSPDVAEPHRGAYRRHQETELPRPLRRIEF